MAHGSNESGDPQVYVQPLATPGAKRQVSVEGGWYPVWRRDGKELFYLQRDSLMVASVTLGAQFEADRPQLLFKGPYWLNADVRNYDVAPDGQSFVMVKKERTFPPTEVIVVLNWLDELKRLVPARN